MFARQLALRIIGMGLAAAAQLAADAFAPGLEHSALAQQGQSITIVVTVVRAEPATRTPLPIQVTPESAVAANSFIRIRGLPPTVALSDGHAIAAGSWAVPLRALPTLNLILPVGLEGRSEISISLVSIEGTELATAKTTLTVAAPTAVAPAAVGSAMQPSVSLGLAAPRMSPEDRERALGLHAKGMEQADRGQIYAARKFFERAAEIGLAQSAVAAGATYDPNELSRLGVLGLQPDVEAARKWYEKARQLGASEAEERLRRLRAP
jgi:hypothetical protein